MKKYIQVVYSDFSYKVVEVEESEYDETLERLEHEKNRDTLFPFDSMPSVEELESGVEYVKDTLEWLSNFDKEN